MLSADLVLSPHVTLCFEKQGLTKIQNHSQIQKIKINCMNFKCSKILYFCLANKEGHISLCSEHAFRGRHMEESIARDSLKNRWQNSPRTAVSRTRRKASLTNSLSHHSPHHHEESPEMEPCYQGRII